MVFLLLLVTSMFLVELTRGESFIAAYAAVPYEISRGVDYSDLFPDLFELKVGRFYIQLASERGPDSVLKLIKEHAQSNQMIFVGVIDPINPNVETPEEVRDRILEAAEYIPLDQLGSADDCGFSPFGDDTSTSRELAWSILRSGRD